jgi:AraC-like DNA-binding protein
MGENADQKYKVYNPESENCPVCTVLNSIYRADSFHNEMEIPEKIGKGYYRRIIVKPSMEISITDVSFYKSMTMVGRQENSPLYNLSFCLGDTIRWRIEENKEEYEIESGENYISKGYWGNGICRYRPGQRFWGISIRLDSEIITSLIQHLGKENLPAGLSDRSGTFYKRQFSSAIKLILNEIINCRYRDEVKMIYLEGKVLELIAVYLDELIYENGRLNSSARLSSSDIKSLHNARRILDENITFPPTLEKLARLVCLNRYKLKTGFKELFGLPVHAYIIDKRLEMARFLMEDKKLKVTEAVLLVGYSDASHFAEKFRKKYGVNPSEYRKIYKHNKI